MTATETGTSGATTRPIGLRTGLRRLSRGLIAYGVVGLIIALLGLIALAYAGSRIGAVADRATTAVEDTATTLDRSADALHDAATTARSFMVTLTRSSEAVSQAADTIRGVRPELLDLETQFRSFSVLGARPLTQAADVVGEIAADLEGFDARLDAVASSLAVNRDSLQANAMSLDALGDSLAALAERMRTGILEDSLQDVQVVVTILLLVLVAWTAVPAAGALLFGWWLRARLGPGGEAPPPTQAM